MSLLQRLLGKDGSSQLGIDSTHFAARITGRPMHVGARGSYALSWRSGIMAAGLSSDAEIFQMRWTSSTLFMLLRSVIFNAWRDTTAFATGSANFYATHARSWSADGGGGTAVVFSTNNTNKRRTDHALSAFSDTGVRGSATAALTAGTKTFDTNPFASVGAFISSAATSVPDYAIIAPGTYLWQRNTHDEYPMLYEQNEGFSIRAVVPATGTWRFSVNVEWAEIDPAVVEGWT
jgi:hypothetical protein